MELRQLQSFEAVARQGHFTAAAAELRIAQPAVSAQIRRLERELGTVLFDRTTRRVHLTQAGETLLRRARAVLHEVDGAKSDLRDLAGILRGRLHLGATPVLGSLDLPRALAGFHRRYPDVNLAVRTGLIGNLLDRLSDGTVDVVAGPIHADVPQEYAIERLSDETVVLIAAPGSLGQRTGPLALTDVADRSFACLPAGTGLRRILIQAADRAGFQPRIQFEASDPAGIRQFVSSGLGVAIVARSATDQPGPPVDVHTLTPEPAHPPIGLIRLRRRRQSPTVRAWYEHVRTMTSG